MMSRVRPSLSFRVRYEGRAQTFDRRPLKEAETDNVKRPIHYMVARTLSLFRGRWEVPPPPAKLPDPKPTSRAAPDR
jgi:hypothetical protein